MKYLDLSNGQRPELKAFTLTTTWVAAAQARQRRRGRKIGKEIVRSIDVPMSLWAERRTARKWNWDNK